MLIGLQHNNKAPSEKALYCYVTYGSIEANGLNFTPHHMRTIVFLFSLLFCIATAAQGRSDQQPLQMRATLPHFLRQGDRLELPATITNTGINELTGQAELQLTDAATSASVDGWFQNVFPNQYFTVGAKDSTVVHFPIEVPYSFYKTARWRFFARTGKDSAIASGLMPVLAYHQAFWHTAFHQGSGSFSFPGLLQSGSSESLQHASVQVEMAATPAAFAYTALPYLLQHQSLKISTAANRLFAVALLLRLQQQEPAAAIQLLQAHSSKLGQPMTDTAVLQQQIKKVTKLLQQQQQKSGAFPIWVNGATDIVTTQYTALVIGRLLQLQALPYNEAVLLQSIAKKSMHFLKGSGNTVPEVENAYLESLLYQKQPFSKSQNWVTAALGQQSLSMQAMMATLLWRRGDTALATRVLQLALQKSTNAKTIRPQSFWENSMLESALLLEAAHLTQNTAGADAIAIQLLQQKEPGQWPTPEGITAAVYALLLHTKGPLTTVPDASVQLGKLPKRTVPANSYLFTYTVEAGLVQPSLGNITVQQAGNKPLFTRVHWHYFDDTTISNAGIELTRQWRKLKGTHKEQLTDGAWVAVGDTIAVQLEINSFQPQSDLRLTDGWPAGFIPLPIAPANANKREVLERTDLGQKEWLLAKLPAGRTVFIYRLKAVHAGTFSSGPTVLQPLYRETPIMLGKAVRLNVE